MRAGELNLPFWERGLKANVPIVLWREWGQVEMERWRFDGEIRVELDFWPKPKVQVVMDLPMGSDVPTEGDEFVIRSLSGERRMVGSLVENWASSTGSGRVVLRPNEEWVIGDVSATVDSIGFGVPNFPPFRRDNEVIQIQAGQWRVEIAPAAGASETCNQLKRRGGFGVTAIGRVRRADGRPLRGCEVAPLWEELRFFLSFVLGQWTGPLRPTGLDGRGMVVWERGSLPPFLEPGVKPENWFSPDLAFSLGGVFPGFRERWNDWEAKEAIRFAIYWYVQAGSGAGVEGALVSSVAGLEVLAFWVLVKRTETWKKEKYKKSNLEEKLRTMFEVAGVPTGLPDMGQFTLQFPWPKGWVDGPEALSKMRNDLMHAEKQLPEVSRQSGWWLSQWYLELSLLWAFEYRGDYLDRRNLGGPPVPVPWASRASV
jgi:hypothetical protein